jgi:serine/threonine kinase
MPSRPRGGSPASHRTPIFPQLSFSQDPIYRRRRGIILLILILLITVILIVTSWWWADGRFTTTPDITNVSQDQAAQALQANNLDFTTQEAFSEEVPVGSVISSDPAAGSRTLRGTKVTVTISKGPERHAMPEVEGQELAKARADIESNHLLVGQVKENWSESVESGRVISASQPVGTLLPRDTSIDLVVSKGRQPLAIKDYTNKDADQASKELKDQGFKVEVSEAHSDTVAAGLVISQDPASGNGHRGDVVKLEKSLGPEMVAIPDVALKRTDEAQKILESAGFKVEVQNTSSFPLPIGLASGTSPGAGTMAPKGSTVTLLVA